ncbi:MAG: AI-2E family transporter, partial [Candidatus Aminicenantes bacterium]
AADKVERPEPKGPHKRELPRRPFHFYTDFRYDEGRGGRVDKNRFVKFGVGIVVLFLLGVFLKLAKPVLIPFCLALLFAFAVAPALDFLVRRKVPKSIALVVILLLTFAVLYLIGTVFYASGKSFADELPSYNEMAKSLLERIDHIVPDPRLKVGLTDWVNGLNVARMGTLFISALGPFFSFMSQLLIIFVFMIFILSGRGRMTKKFAEAFPPDQASALGKAAFRINCEIQKYLGVKTLTNLLIGVLVTAVLAVFGVRFAIVFGVLAFFFNYVPALGAIVSVVLPVLLTTFLEGSFSLKVGLVLALLATVHVALRRFLERRLMGKELELSPLLVLFSLFFWAWLWGIPGMVLAVPILAVIKIVFANVPALRFLETMMDK